MNLPNKRHIKNVLIIADRIHAMPRMTTLAEEFKKHGKKVEIYSFSNENEAKHTLSHVEKKENIFKKFLRKITFFRSIFGLISYLISYPDEYFYKWYLKQKIEIDNLILNFKPDIVISSSSPISAHLIAYRVCTKFNIKWCADFRDMWSLNHNHKGKFIGKFLDGLIEKKILTAANVITTTTPMWAETLSKYYGREVHSITNGFCENKYKLQPNRKIENRVIRYSGTIYEEMQKKTFDKFLKAISMLNDKTITFEIYGPTSSWIKDRIRANNLEDQALVIGPIDNKLIANIQMTSSLNVIFGCNHSGFIDGYYLKMFEYIGARRPILFVSDERYEEASAVLLRDFPNTYEASSVEEIAMKIKLSLHEDYLNPDSSILESYTFRKLANDYMRIIEN